jgi:APA family basic amino acid/polyamine antiporter
VPGSLTDAPASGASFHPSTIRDAGLLRQIGPLALAAAIINGVVGAGIFSLPSAMSQAAGNWAPLAYLLCAIAMGMVVTCCAEAGSRLPTSGGIYGYVTDAFGPFAGFLSGMMTWMASVLACGGIASAFAGTLGSVLPAASGGLGRAAIILAAIGGITAVNLRGVRGGAGLVSLSTAIKLVPLLLFVTLGLFAAPRDAGAIASTLPAHDFAQAVILGMFAFSGMETVLGASGEVADPNRTVPRALFGAMGFVLLLYVAIQIVAQRLLGPALSHQAAPLAAAAAQVSHAAEVILVAGAAVSMLGWIGSDILGAPRVLFAFARDGLLPAILGRIHPGSRVPHVAILFHACLAASLAISGSFVWLAVAATLNTAGLYFLGCGAAWVLHRRKTQLAGTALNIRFLPVASVLGMASMVLLIGVAAKDEILGFVAVIAASAGIYAVMRWAGKRKARGSAPGPR